MLAARTRDKKKLGDVEVDVFPTWSSTLYITNFPETFDDAQLRELFESVRRSALPISLTSQHGTILETRWPTKRFKNTRRFCYLQFASPASAQSASFE